MQPTSRDPADPDIDQFAFDSSSQSGYQNSVSALPHTLDDRESLINQLFLLLPPDLHQPPYIDWSMLSTRALVRVVRLLTDNSLASPLALAIGSLLGHVGEDTIMVYTSYLHALLGTMQQLGNIQHIAELGQEEIWNEYIATTAESVKKRRLIHRYAVVTQQYVPMYLQRLSPAQHEALQPYALPRAPIALQSQPRYSRLNTNDGDRETHIQALMGWLAPELHTVQGIDWTQLPSRVIGYLVRTVGDHPDRSALALVCGALIGVLQPNAINTHTRGIFHLLRGMREPCGMQNLSELGNARLWKRYATKTLATPTRLKALHSYAVVTQKYLPDYLNRVSVQERVFLQRYVLPPPPPWFLERFGRNKELKTAARKRRKEQTDVLAPLASLLVACVLARKQAAFQMLDEFRRARERVVAGEVSLPYTYIYNSELPEVNWDANDRNERHLQHRSVKVSCTIYRRCEWVLDHPDDFSPDFVRTNRNRQSESVTADELFLQFNGPPEDLLWCGDLIQQRIIRGFRSEKGGDYDGRRARAQAWGSANGITTSRGGLLQPAADIGRWLSQLFCRSNELIFEPEALYRGVLYGAALTILALTNGGRVSELLQVSLEQFRSRSFDATDPLNPTGHPLTVIFQLLLPKGARSETERQPFLISQQSKLLLEEIADQLVAAHGEVPIVEPHSYHPKADVLHRQRYLFQWGCRDGGRYGALGGGDVPILVRFVCHGIHMTTEGGEPIDILPHLLRHIMATAARHEFDVPPEVLAYALHHRFQSVKVYEAHPLVPEITDYYSRRPEGARLQDMHELQVVTEEQDHEVIGPMLDERMLAEMNERLCTAFAVWHTLNPTLFGFCGRSGLCPRGNYRELCIGCPFLVPDPDRIAFARHWEQRYSEKAQRLYLCGSEADAEEARGQAAELRKLILKMRILGEAMHKQEYIPLFSLMRTSQSPNQEADGQGQ